MYFFVPHSLSRHWVLWCTLVALSLFSSPSKAETVKAVTNINKNPVSISAKARTYLSNGRVSFYYKSGLWRVAGATAKKINFPVPARDLSSFFATDDYFYYKSSTAVPREPDRSTLWRISANGRKFNIVAKDLSGFIGPALVHPTTGVIYFGQGVDDNSSGRHGLQIWQLEPDSGTIKKVIFSAARYCFSCAATMAITSTHIFFTVPTAALEEELRSYDIANGTTQRLGKVVNGRNSVLAAADSIVYFQRDERIRINGAPRGGCMIGRSDGTSQGTYLLTDLRESFSSQYLVNWNEICNYELEVISGDAAVFKRVRGVFNFIRPEPTAYEVWRTEGTKPTTRLLSTVFSQTDPKYRCSEQYRTIVKSDVCILDLKYSNGYVWLSNYIVSAPDSTDARQLVTVVDVNSGQTTKIIEGENNLRIDYEPAGDSMLVIQQPFECLRKPDKKGCDPRSSSRPIQYRLTKATTDGLNFQELGNFRDFAWIGQNDRWAYFHATTMRGPLTNFAAVSLSTSAITLSPVPGGEINGSSITRSDAIHEKNGVAYYCADTLATPHEGISSLWRSNGTPSKTRPVVQRLGQPEGGRTNDAACRDIQISDNHIYYTRHNADSGMELWRADRTGGANQRLHIDFTPGAQSSNPANLNMLGNRLLMTASVAGSQRKLVSVNEDGRWRALADVPAFVEIVGSNDKKLVYSASGRSGEQVFQKLWQTDGTRAGTTKLVRGLVRIKANMVFLNNAWYFLGSYKANVSANPTQGLFRINPGRAPSGAVPKLIKAGGASFATRTTGIVELLKHKGSLYVHRTSKPSLYRHRTEVVRLNPATGVGPLIASTRSTVDVSHSVIRSVVSWRNHLYFYVENASGHNNASWQIWRSDGAPKTSKRIHIEPADPVLFTQLNRRGNEPILFTGNRFKASSNAIWFAATDFKNGNELWWITP